MGRPLIYVWYLFSQNVRPEVCVDLIDADLASAAVAFLAIVVVMSSDGQAVSVVNLYVSVRVDQDVAAFQLLLAEVALILPATIQKFVIEVSASADVVGASPFGERCVFVAVGDAGADEGGAVIVT